MKSILITGGTGFIGSHTSLLLLEKGYCVNIIDSNINSSEVVLKKILEIRKEKNSINSDINLNFFKGDIRDKTLLKKIFYEAKQKKRPIEAVIHFAGLKSVEESVQDPLRYWETNVYGSVCLFNVMKENKCKTLVFSSSATVYGVPDLIPIKESSIIKPLNPYGHTKAAIESILENIYKSRKAEWKIVNLRYFNPIGAHESGLLGEDPKNIPNNLFPYICRVASRRYKNLKIFGNDWPTFDGTGVRDYIHVMDLAEAHISALEYLLKSNSNFLNLNIGTAKGTSVLQLVEEFKKINKVDIPYEFWNRRSGDVPEVIADNSLALKILDWKPKKNLEDMCRDGWKWQSLNPSGY